MLSCLGIVYILYIRLNAELSSKLMEEFNNDGSEYNINHQASCHYGGPGSIGNAGAITSHYGMFTHWKHNGHCPVPCNLVGSGRYNIRTKHITEHMRCVTFIAFNGFVSDVVIR